MEKLRAGIIGVSGYTGAIILKLILKHSVFKINYLATSQGGERLEDIHPQFDKICNLPIHKADPKEAASMCDVVFLALPHGSSFHFVKEILKANSSTKIVDLSADYRLDLKSYEANYCPHEDKQNLKNAIYGLVEYARDLITSQTRLIANPGCYPTATLLGVLPFVNMIESNIFIDAKSGVSGAGKKLSANTHYPYINENIFAYSPISHRHACEISQKISLDCKEEHNISFVPHLTPLNSGMLVSIYATLKPKYKDINPLDILKDRYKNDFFVRIKNESVNVANVRETNFCDIYAMNNHGALFINTSIDNLYRGASSQAVANANLLFNLSESTDLI